MTYEAQHHRRLDRTVRIAEQVTAAPAIVLDIGPHILTQRLRQVFGRVDSLGFDTEDLDLRPGEKHVEHDLNLMPWPRPERYDLVTCCEVVEHLRLPLPLALHELKALLKPDGKLLLSVPNAASLKNRIKLALGRQPFPLKAQAEHGDWGHWREPTRREVETAAKSVDLEVSRFESRSDLGHAGSCGTLYNWITSALPPGFRDRLTFVLTAGKPT